MVTVAIDIGHAYNTPGKRVTRNGKTYKEHSFNSKLAEQLKANLDKTSINAIYGQQKPHTNSEVGLTTRTNWYNNQGVDFVISLHANAGK